jgi:hypothetical protein
MAIATKNRKDLKSYFVKNAIPTEGNFADLVDAQLNQSDDGVFKLTGEPLSVVAASGDQKRVLRLYANYPAANPDWLISLNPAQNPANAATNRAGFGIADGAGNTRLFIDPGTGNLGVGTNNPADKLSVQDGDVRIEGGRYRRLKIVSDKYWAGIELVAREQGEAGSPHIDFTHGQLDDPNFGIRVHGVDNNTLQISAGAGSATLDVRGAVQTTGLVSTPGGLMFEGAVAHIDRDGALYRNTDGQCYLTVDDNLYIRDMGSSTWAAHVDVNNGNINLKGNLTANRLRGQNTLTLNTYQTANPSSNVFLYSQGGDRDAWIYLDSGDVASNWGIYHRQIDSAVAGLPGNSIGFVGGGTSKLQAYVSLQDGSAFFAGNVQVSGTRLRNASGLGIVETGANDWLRVNPDESFPSIALYKPVAIGSGGLAVGEWSVQPTGQLKTTGAASFGGLVTALAGVKSNALVHAAGNGGVLNIEGNDHAYIQWYPMKVAAGRKGWIGYGNVNTTAMHVQNDAGELNLGGTVVRVATGMTVQSIGICSQDHGATSWPYETIQVNPAHNLRIWFGTKQRFILENTGQFTIQFDQGMWIFQSDGNLVKYNKSGQAIWALNNVSGKAGW